MSDMPDVSDLRYMVAAVHCATPHMAPIARVLFLADALREVYGDIWAIEADDDGTFAIKLRE